MVGAVLRSGYCGWNSIEIDDRLCRQIMKRYGTASVLEYGVCTTYGTMSVHRSTPVMGPMRIKHTLRIKHYARKPFRDKMSAVRACSSMFPHVYVSYHFYTIKSVRQYTRIEIDSDS